MPQSQDKSGEYHDIAFPLTGDLRKEISAAVMDEYNRVAELAPNKRGYDAPDMSAANAKNAADVKLDIRVYPLDEPKGATKAFASVSVDDLVAIRGVRVVEGEKGAFAAMPQSQDKNGEYHDIAFPVGAELRKAINKAVVKEYKEAVKAPEKSLADGLKKGAEKAAGHETQKNTAAKSRAGAIE
jgi:stage V sporulation protein G